ncbi:MAG: exodeoxyribonuclease III [Pseudomonadota bacterium]
MIWKLATFNVNGIRARLEILIDWLKTSQPDVLCLQETKCQDKDFPLPAFEAEGYSAAYWGQKSFNGVAVLTRRQLTEIQLGFSDGQPETEARMMTVLVDGVWVVNTYVPQGRSPDDPAFQAKLNFFSRLDRWFKKRFSPSQPLIWTGDLNVAPEPIDVFDPERLEGEVGFHPEERKALASVSAWGFNDLFRKFNPTVRQFTFWDYRLPHSFKRNLGWRLDHILATRPMINAARGCQVDTEPRGKEKPSDHTPVWAEFDLAGL